ncbi:hypothetical protein KSP39_PZI016746 [Platanthera zijinensis]|uniref:Uncharacterized protein n=1 Tax=Platanthera zijinensis TaxID=2320716 RepID=A0AAP0B8G8_9ASPA
MAFAPNSPRITKKGSVYEPSFRLPVQIHDGVCSLCHGRQHPNQNLRLRLIWRFAGTVWSKHRRSKQTGAGGVSSICTRRKEENPPNRSFSTPASGSTPPSKPASSSRTAQ